MRFHRAVTKMATTAASAVAFTPSGRSFLGRSIAITELTPRFSGGASIASNLNSRAGGVASLPMNILERFFGGGANALTINYSKLDHPGPELAALAQDNGIRATSTRDPHLHLATFAGGCFWGMELAYQRVPGVVYTAAGYTQRSEEGK